MNKNNKYITKKRSEMISSMKKNISSLEEDINHYNFLKFKINALKNFKIFLQVMRMISPWFLSSAVVISIFYTFFGMVPFRKFDTKKMLHSKTEIDNDKKLTIEEQYESFQNDSNQIIYSSRWEKDDDGLYKQNVMTYSLDDVIKNVLDIVDDIDIENVYDLFDVLSKSNHSDIFKKPISSKTIKKSDISLDELSKEPSYKAILYSIDNDNVIIQKSSNFDTVLFNIGWILLSILSGVLCDRLINRNFYFSCKVDEIKDSYSVPDKEQLIKKLSILKDNYNRFTR